MLRALLIGLLLLSLVHADGVRFATYNVKDYLLCDRSVDGVFKKNYPKPEHEKKALWNVIREANPDVLALQEIGGKEFLEELQRDLKEEGLDFPYSIIFADPKTPSRYTAVLSKFKLQNPQTHVFTFDYFGHEEIIKRGLLEATISIDSKPCTLFVVHLKSRLAEEKKDPNSTYFRESEANLIRDYLWKRYFQSPDARFLLVGDFNDVPQSATLRVFLKKGKQVFMHRIPAHDLRGETWTYHFGREEGYSCSDYLLVSQALASHVINQSGAIVDTPTATIASDHRLLYVDIQGQVTPEGIATTQ